MPLQLLDAWPSLVDVAEAASGSGIRVSVLQASQHTERLVRAGVHYYFQPFGDAPALGGSNNALRELLRQLSPDVVHVHGLGFPRHVLSLSEFGPGCSDPAAGPCEGAAANLAPSAMAARAWRERRGLAFCASGASLRPSPSRPGAPPRRSCIRSRNRPVALRQGIGAGPAARPDRYRRRARGAVGRALDANKDPLTVLAGVSAAAGTLPGLRLYCCFGNAPLLRAVPRTGSPPIHALHERVQLLGPRAA